MKLISLDFVVDVLARLVKVNKATRRTILDLICNLWILS